MDRLPTFQVWTDHHPLVGIFQKDLTDIDNPRLQNFREKIQHFNFEVRWVVGKTHYIANALSQFPVFEPDPKNKDYKVNDAITCMGISSDPGLEVKEEISYDKNYQLTIKALYDDADPAKLPDDHQAKEYMPFFHDLSIRQNGEQDLLLKDGKKTVVPQLAQQRILKTLHHAHSCSTKTYAYRQLYYRPNMKKEIEKEINNCRICQAERPSQARPA